MHRVVVTGMGIISCIGNTLEQVEQALRNNRSGIHFAEEYACLGLGSCVAGIPDVSTEPPIERKIRRYMGDASIYAYHAMRHALEDAGLAGNDISDPRTGLVVGSAVGSPFHHNEAISAMREKGLHKVTPYTVPRVMGSTTSGSLATAFCIRGHSYSITSACATSAHCIGHAMELIQSGKQDMMFAGGSEEVCWTTTMPFDAMGILSTRYNNRPETASRPFDSDRDGFVISGGAGILVLEQLARARARGAKIYAELVGYGASSDGADMITPTPEGAARAMRLALQQAGGGVDYINAHANSTKLGDIAELKAIAQVFGECPPRISSTKGLTGHPIAAAAVHEVIYSLLMLNKGFVAPTANLRYPDPEVGKMPLVRDLIEHRFDRFMSNSFGFGGTNASLVLKRFP